MNPTKQRKIILKQLEMCTLPKVHRTSLFTPMEVEADRTLIICPKHLPVIPIHFMDNVDATAHSTPQPSRFHGAGVMHVAEQIE